MRRSRLAARNWLDDAVKPESAIASTRATAKANRAVRASPAW
jgi:hypothetical protein